MTTKEAIERMWSYKNHHILDMNGIYDHNSPINPNFGKMLYATLMVDYDMNVWNGYHPVEDNTVTHRAKAGARVLVTMISRFGDVGIRDRSLNPPTNGYWARIDPEQLCDWSETKKCPKKI